MPIVYVLLGGFLGAAGRFLVGTLFTGEHSFPLATFTVNIIGCFLLGLLFNILKSKYPFGFLLICTGFIGSFTTFSTLAVESLSLMETGRYGLSFLYMFLSVALGLIFGFIGYWISINKKRKADIR